MRMQHKHYYPAQKVLSDWLCPSVSQSVCHAKNFEFEYQFRKVHHFLVCHALHNALP